jgi:hypothetical protein
MLSVRLPETLEMQLTAYCQSMHMTKSSVVQAALEKHLRQARAKQPPAAQADPFLALVGSGNGKFTTDEIMRMSRGDDWNQP